MSDVYNRPPRLTKADAKDILKKAFPNNRKKADFISVFNWTNHGVSMIQQASKKFGNCVQVIYNKKQPLSGGYYLFDRAKFVQCGGGI